MKSRPKSSRVARKPLSALALSVSFAATAVAGTLTIADQPLATGSGLSVKPNLLFILDDSGSMDSGYTPDWVNDSICQDSLSTFGSTHGCNSGSGGNNADPPYMSGNFNRQYYNPAIRYSPPRYYNGNEWSNADPAAAVTGDIFRGSTSTTNLKTSYPDVYWCRNAGDTAPGPNCHNNEGTHYGYGYPNNVWANKKTVNGAPYYYVLSGSPTWCDSKSLTTCEADRTSSTYKYPKFSAAVTATAGSASTPEVPAKRSKITITVSKSSNSKSIQGVKCGKDNTGASAFSGTYTPPDSNTSTLANWLKDKLTACSNPGAGAWVITYPSASGNNSEIDVSWPVEGTVGDGNKFYIGIDTNSGTAFTVKVSGSDVDNSSMPSPLSGFSLSGGQDYQAEIPGVADVITFPNSGVQFQKIVIDPSVTQYDKGPDRSDCVAVNDGSDPDADGVHCSYKQELQNFANWYQYYRTRMLMMKSSVSRVFASVSDTAPGNGFRIGFDRISRSSADLELEIAPFTTTAAGQKKSFYDYLFAANPTSSTPLRGALSKAGRVFAGVISPDPVQVSCQQNFAFLSTDGYWNTGDETASYGPFKENGTSSVGDQDGTGSPAMAASVTLSVTTANNTSPKITEIKCGASSATATTISSTYTVSGWGSATRKANTAAWLASKLTQCSNPTEGAWQIGYSDGSPNVTISWPVNDVSGNGKAFYLDIKVSSTSDLVATLGSTTVTKSSIPASLDSATLSGGAAATSAQNRPYLDALGIGNTLADVAMYYWKNDLRGSLTNDVPTSSRDPAYWQHMTTFTMGLGIDGTLRYATDYETGGSPDFTELVAGHKDWPDPISNTTDARVDDLWHAAVNGHGLYFSASSPDQVITQFNTAISTIASITGAAAAAATSNLEPTAGDNYAYVASYRTQVWDGDLQAKEIDLVTGDLSEASSWSGAYKLGSQTSRALYTFDTAAASTDKKRVLSWTNLSGTEQGYFAVSQLNQCDPVTMCPGATAQNLFEYLMGGSDTTTNKSYRARQSISDPASSANSAVANRLGDIVSSQPVFVGAPNLLYTENDYAAFKAGTAASRGKTVYVGANDGFIHAFNADTGVERWAYMPRVLLSSLYKIARTDYAHEFYQDGTIAVTDAYDGSNWRTVLVSGMNKGGNYYVGLDVTDPSAPQALWEFSDASLGYSYGNPIIAKLPAGTTSSGGVDIGGRWVALLTSGYNNSGNGQGVLYVVDVFTGQELFRMTTTSTFASASSPIGLARINAWADDPTANNTATYVYGGDLNGDLWRFSLADKTVLNVAAVGEPITVKPELVEITSGSTAYRVIAFGTGLFLQSADKSDTSPRTVFAIKDTGATQTNLKTNGNFVEQTLSVISGDDTHRTTTTNTVDWSQKNGWYVNLPDTRERVNVDPKLVLGTLVVASNVPQDTSADSCTAGGYSWLNYFDVETGAYVDSTQTNSQNYASTKMSNALSVGINVVKLPSGQVVGIVTTSDNKHQSVSLPIGASSSTAIRRISWREIVAD